MTTLSLDSPINQALSTSSPPTERAPSRSSPNVIFISVDDLNDWIGPLKGYPGVKTPNIDRLAASGMVFANAHTPAPICNAARTSVLTGLQPDTTRVFDNSQNWVERLPNVVTLPEYFRANGYKDVGIGKIMHTQSDAAFQSFFPSSGPNLDGIDRGQFGSVPLNIPIEKFADAQVAAFAEDYLAKKHQSPFFMGLGFNRPHVPLAVPKRFFDLYPLDEIKLPRVLANDLNDIPKDGQELAGVNLYQRILESGEWKNIVRAYLASISFMDAMVGRVLNALEESAYANNTMVVLWSDHGWHLGEKLHWQKETLWEEATRVPLIISGPGIRNEGAVTEKPVSLVDVFPTLVDLAGLPPKENLEGQSLVPLIKNPNRAWDKSAVTVWENGYAVRSEHFRYIRYVDGTEELYDHREDPNEFRNLAKVEAFAEVKAELKGDLNQYFEEFVPRRVIDNFEQGTGRDDRIEGSPKDDTILGAAGDDSLEGLNGDEQLFGGQNRDVLQGDAGADTLFGGEGDDRLGGGEGSDRLVGDDGRDSLIAGLGADVLDGGADNDTLTGGEGQDTLLGGDGNDLLVGGGGRDDDLINGAKGQDTLEVSGRIRDFSGVRAGTSVIVDRTGEQGRDRLEGIEFIQFDDARFEVRTGEVLRGGRSQGMRSPLRSRAEFNDANPSPWEDLSGLQSREDWAQPKGNGAP